MASASKPASLLRAQWSKLFAPAERTLPAMLTRQAERHAKKPLVSVGDTTWSYADACDTAARFAAALRGAGVKAGDRVAVICSNRIEFLEILFGCAWLGAVAVPINVASRGPQLQHILSNCGARLLVLEDVHADNLAMLDARRLAVEAIWLIGAKGNLGFGNAAVAPMPRGGERIAAAAVRPGDLGLILYTSGTTGPSKGVCCPHAQYFWWAVNTASLLQLRDGDVLCTSLPLFHTNALNTFYQALLDGRLRALREAVFRLRLFSVAGAKPRHRHLSARRHGADPAVAAGVPGRNRTSGQHRARARRAGAVSRRVHAAHRHPPARRLGLDRNQFRPRHDDRAPAARIDGAGVRGLRCARGRRSAAKTPPTERRAS